MTKQAGPMRIEQYKPRMYENSYKISRFLCPACCRRYGEPADHGYMDLKRCETCPKFKVQNNE